MIKQKTHRVCEHPECDVVFKKYKSTDKYCSRNCQESHKPTINKPRQQINKVSKKQAVINAKYSVQRIQFLAKPENQICFIDGCNKKATTVEHTMGRKGFADDYARENNIPLTLDERFWKPCCLIHNLELENNSELSNKYQLSKIHGGKKIIE